MRIGFVGTGLMGAPMAGHLQAAGHELILLPHRTPAPETLLDGGAQIAASAAELARASEVVIAIVPDTPDVDDLLFRGDGLASGLQRGALFIDMSTISPVATQGFAEKLSALGVGYVDAPVSGGDIGARAAALTIMVGGADADVARAMPLFEVMGKTITHLGPVGTGQTCKAANQIVVGVTLNAVAEALVFASRAGADPTKVRSALLGGFASSRILEVHGQRMLNGDFAPGFKAGLHAKDLAIVLDQAEQMGLPLPATAIVRDHLLARMQEGETDADHSIIVKEVGELTG